MYEIIIIQINVIGNVTEFVPNNILAGGLVLVSVAVSVGTAMIQVGPHVCMRETF